MSRNKVLLFVFNGFADWEPAYVMPEINKSGKYQIETVALTKEPVKSMGGLTVLPDKILEDFRLEDLALFILPGGTAWEEKKFKELIPVIQQFKKEGIPIAAICAATTILADAGLLDKISHTSNAKSYIKSSSTSYQGGDNYKDEPAVFDANIITASGTAPIEFAREIFRLLSIYDEETLEKWFVLFRHGIWPW